MTLSRSLVLFGVSTLLLAACGEIREDLGLGRNPPDEFAVVERPPLSMPPDYGLSPPRPGAPRPQAVDADQQARSALFEAGAKKTSAKAQAASGGEQALLAASGAAKADPGIRNVIDRESAQKAVASPHLVERLPEQHYLRLCGRLRPFAQFGK